MPYKHTLFTKNMHTYTIMYAIMPMVFYMCYGSFSISTAPRTNIGLDLGGAPSLPFQYRVSLVLRAIRH